MCYEHLGLAGYDMRHPSPQQWARLRKVIISRAYAERRQVIRHMAETALGAVRRCSRLAHRLIDGFQIAARRHLARRRRFRDLRELSAMNNLELKDVGISR